MFSLEEIKNFIDVDDSVTDEKISAYISQSLKAVRDYTKKNFLSKVSTTTEGVLNGVILGDFTSFKVGDVVELYGSEDNYLVYTIKEKVTGGVKVEQSLTDEYFNGHVIKLSFKGVSTSEVADLVSYLVSEVSKEKGLVGESMGGYSYTKVSSADSVNGIPKSIMATFDHLKQLSSSTRDYLWYNVSRYYNEL